MLLEFIRRFRRTVRNWPMYLFNRYFQIKYHLRNGLTMYVRPIDRCPFNDVFIIRHYDVDIPWQSLRTIIDVGANVGSFTLFASKKSPDATVISIEPDFQHLTQLYKNMVINHLPINILPVAIGADDSVKTLILLPSGEATLYGESKSTIRAQGITLKQLIDTYGDIGLLKMDCEGAEYETIYALPKEMFSRIQFIVLEYHHFVPGQTPDRLKAYLESVGYEVTVPRKSFFLASRRR